MFNWIKRMFCQHRYEKTITSRNERCLFDNLLIYEYKYRCEKCGKTFIIEEIHEIERDYYKPKIN